MDEQISYVYRLEDLKVKRCQLSPNWAIDSRIYKLKCH